SAGSWARRRSSSSGTPGGSYLGLKLAGRHPDWLYAYVGVGQLTDGPESERRGWAFALDAARRGGERGGRPRAGGYRSVLRLRPARTAQALLHPAKVARLLRWRDGFPAGQLRRERACRPVAGLHRRRDLAHLAGQRIRRALPPAETSVPRPDRDSQTGLPS